MDYRRLEESQIADYEIGTLSVDYVRHTITIELKSPQNRLDILQIAHFEEVSITKKEPWGAGSYVASSAVEYCGEHTVLEIELNSGDQIKITMKANS